MKGIRKLFYGFVLMALFSVGFKIEAKAALAPAQPQGPTGNNWDIADTSTAITGKITFTAGGADFPDATAVAVDQYAHHTYMLQMKQGTSDLGDPIYVTLWTKKVTSTPTYEYYYSTGDQPSTAEGASKHDVSNTATSIDSLISITKQSVVLCFGTTRTSGTKSFTLVLSEADGSNSTTSGPLDVRMYEISVDSNPTALLTGDKIALTFNGEKYLLPGETTTINRIVIDPELGYKFTVWQLDATTNIADVGGVNDPSQITVKLLTTASTTGNTKVTASHTVATLTFTPSITTTTHNSPLKPLDTYSTGTFTFTGGYKGSNVARASVGTSLASSVDCPAKSFADATSGTFSFQVPDSTADGTPYLYLTMTDGTVFKTQFTVKDETTVKLEDDVMVTVDKSIALSKYVKSGNPSKSAIATLSGSAASYAKMSSSTATVLTNLKITGTTATDTHKVTTLTLKNAAGTELDTTAITVFPQPSIELNSSSGDSGSLDSSKSSSSSSTTSPFKIIMPTGVYHDDIKWSDVKKAKVVFHRSGKDDKTATLTLDSSSSSSSLTKSASPDSMAVSDIIEDMVGDDDKYTLTITVYPMNGDTVDTGVSASHEITAYRIELDGSAGAKYTVNDKEVSGHFYAVKGTTYKIKSSAKNSGDKFQNWDDTVFSSESGGSYKVLGARKFKANYSSSSSSSSSQSSSGRNTATNGESTGSGDYDDVPKTGESKTDIWILWSVLMISILGAGFMIWKRFGLARAIAEAEEQVAVAEHEEQVRAEKKAKKDKLDMLKDLRNL